MSSETAGRTKLTFIGKPVDPQSAFQSIGQDARCLSIVSSVFARSEAPPTAFWQ